MVQPRLDHQVCQEVAEHSGGIDNQGCSLILLLEVASLRTPQAASPPSGPSPAAPRPPAPLSPCLHPHEELPGWKTPAALAPFPVCSLTVGTVEINEDHPNKNKQKLFIQSWL